MKTLIAVKLSEVNWLSEHTVYLPELALLSELELMNTLTKVKPNILIIGSNLITEKIILCWRQVMGPDNKLFIIRRGTSIVKIDIASAVLNNIQVFNTPGINAPFVTDYIIRNCDTSILPPDSKVSIIGSGSIGSRLIKYYHKKGFCVGVYSPSLIQKDTRRVTLKKKGIDNLKGLLFYSTPAEAANGADVILIAANAQEIKKNNAYLEDSFINSIKEGAQIINISEYEIFLNKSLRKLIKLAEDGRIKLVIDNSPFDIIEIKKLLNHPSSSNIKLLSAAIASVTCQQYLDFAITIQLARIILEINSSTNNYYPITCKQNNQNVTIIGGGITGLVNAIFLILSGYTVTIVEEIMDPEHLQIKERIKSTSWDSPGARYLSLTETLSYSSAIRKEALRTLIEYGGWRINDKLNAAEEQWIKTFENIASFPELNNLLTYFVVNLNAYSLSMWEVLFKKIPEIGTGVIQDAKVVRLFRTEDELINGLAFQQQMHKMWVPIKQPKLINNEEITNIIGVEIKNIVGGVEVAGNILNFQNLLLNIKRWLKKQGVKFIWNTKVTNIIVDNKHIKLETNQDKKIFSDWLVSTGHKDLLDPNSNEVHSVLGCWITIANNQNLKQGFKLHEEDPLSVINITVSEDKSKIFICGGFGYYGTELSADNSEVKNLFTRLELAVKKYLPGLYNIDDKNWSSRKVCIRPMTADGLPVFKHVDNNGVFWISGTNAGGTVQAPILARLLVNQLSSEKDPSFNIVSKLLAHNRYTLKSDTT